MASAFEIPLNTPRPAAVRTGREGVPVEVDGRAVELVRESWLVEDRWWTAQPLRRRYWEVVTTTGRNIVVFHDRTAKAQAREGAQARVREGARALAREGGVGLTAGGWFAQWS